MVILVVTIKHFKIMIELTIFKNIFDNKTHRSMEFDSLENFENLLYKLSTQPAYKPAKGEKPTKAVSPLISPAIFEPHSTRKNKNVIAWAGFAMLDIDDYEGNFDEIMNSFGDSYFICYSTASSRKEHPKFRLVFPLTEYVPAIKIKHFWYALNQEYLGIADAQTKDLSRMFYVPGQYPDAYNFIFTRPGPLISPNELMSKYEYQETKTDFFDNLPEALQKEIINQRKAQQTNTEYSWTSWRDCPFVKKELVAEYRALTSGWYHTMYRLMTSIAANAIVRGYPISAIEIANLCKQIDSETGEWYKNRDFVLEANRAIEFVYKSK